MFWPSLKHRDKMRPEQVRTKIDISMTDKEAKTVKYRGRQGQGETEDRDFASMIKHSQR